MSDPNTVYSITDSELLRRSVLSLKPRLYKPLCACVMESFGLGSTYAWQLCKRFGLNPDATNRKDIKP